MCLCIVFSATSLVLCTPSYQVSYYSSAVGIRWVSDSQSFEWELRTNDIGSTCMFHILHTYTQRKSISHRWWKSYAYTSSDHPKDGSMQCHTPKVVGLYSCVFGQISVCLIVGESSWVGREWVNQPAKKEGREGREGREWCDGLQGDI